MAVITISRQVAALGDEIAAAAAKKLGYVFVDRSQIEQKIINSGFPKEKLPKYDERKPGFFASLAKDCDEYLYYLRLAVLEAASQNNCILIGRGAFAILEEVPNKIALRLVSDDSVRLQRLQKEFNWNEKQAYSRINESDANRAGFHKSFFNIDNDSSVLYDAVLNTGILSVEEAVSIIETLVKTRMNQKKESSGTEKLKALLEGQRLVNRLVLDFHSDIKFLQANVEKEKIVLKGVADSQVTAEKAVQTAARILPTYTVVSDITIVQDFKSYP